MSTVSFPALEPLIIEAAQAPGHFAEFGVFRGGTFLKMLPLARRFGKRCVAVDSFCGMGEPGPMDGGEYPAGKFNVGGYDSLLDEIIRLGCVDVVDIHAGFVPDVLDQVIVQQFAFAHVDLDHYQPTVDTLLWLWPRVSPAGIICVHDYFEGEPGLASAAVRDVAEQLGQAFDVVSSREGVTVGVSSHAVFRKDGE